MGTRFRILPELGLCYVRFDGLIRASEADAEFTRYTTHPDARPGQKQFVDFSAVTEIEPDYAGLAAHQAHMAAYFLSTTEQTLMVFYAPTEPGRFAAALAVRPWEQVAQVVARVFDDERAALDFLGLEALRLGALLERTP